MLAERGQHIFNLICSREDCMYCKCACADYINKSQSEYRPVVMIVVRRRRLCCYCYTSTVVSAGAAATAASAIRVNVDCALASADTR